MKWIETGLCAGIFLSLLAAKADEKLPVLKSGDNIYSNVTVTSVTATDIYFTHSGGIGNAKLKNLAPDLQKHFHFNAAKAGEAEKSQAEATAQFKQNILTQKSPDRRLPSATYDNGDVVVPEIFAHSFRGERPPPVYIDEWVTSPPQNPQGKFVLIVFFITGAEQCRNAIPHIDELAGRFRDRLTVIGLSNEPKAEILKMKSPQVNFFVGTDTQSRSLQAFEVTMIPHAILLDPAGIVRFEGPPVYLQEKDVQHLLDTYAQ
jgi:hypothetical protein